MSFLYNFLIELFYNSPQTSFSDITLDKENEDDDIFIVKHLVTIHDIKSVRLNPVKEADVSSQKEYDDLKKLISNVKLNHVQIDNKKNKEYKHRHPVLNELREKFKK
jgi:hypothetical protein